MKTILKDGVYSRVSNEVGDSQVAHHGFKFVPKQDWKKNVRDIEKIKATIQEAKAEAELQAVEKPIKKPYQKPKRS